MRFVTYAGEKSVSELVKAYYGALGAADSKRAEALILEANPRLKSLRDVPRGAVLRLPPLTTKRLAAAPDGEDTAMRLEVYVELFQRFAGELRAAIESEGEALKEDQQIGTDVKRAIQEVPEADGLLEEVRRGLKARGEILDQARQLLKVLPEIHAVVEKMQRN